MKPELAFPEYRLTRYFNRNLKRCRVGGFAGLGGSAIALFMSSRLKVLGETGETRSQISPQPSQSHP
ncbi:MAG: hypothetical protein RIB93_01580 [Coleofasciculus sp. D1-CHI-01]|uniref:hypothetical protein n=1 Tax=unclassified Coleofasciculus TaxID=2692782 RepID=UPI0033016FD9